MYSRDDRECCGCSRTPVLHLTSALHLHTMTLQVLDSAREMLMEVCQPCDFT